MLLWIVWVVRIVTFDLNCLMVCPRARGLRVGIESGHTPPRLWHPPGLGGFGDGMGSLKRSLEIYKNHSALCPGPTHSASWGWLTESHFIGQGFIDDVFRVAARAHQGIVGIPIAT